MPKFSLFFLCLAMLSGCATFARINVDEVRLRHESEPLYGVPAAGKARRLVATEGYREVLHEGKIHLFADEAAAAAFAAAGRLDADMAIARAAIGPFGEEVVAAGAKGGPAPETLLETYRQRPHLLVRLDADYFVWMYLDRYYVIGNYASSLFFERHHELVLTKTLFNRGPHGETVQFEVDKKDDAMVERLMAQFEETPWLLEKRGEEYFLWKFRGRMYVIGDRQTSDRFSQLRRVEYSPRQREMEIRTIRDALADSRVYLNAGPQGETVVVAESASDPGMLERLLREYFGSEGMTGLF
ncbi:MAG: hypothetical protein AB1568_08275 [Thermodesulfobacteriota bacterium]